MQDLTSDRQYRLYVSRKNRGGGLTSIKDYIDALTHGLEGYI